MAWPDGKLAQLEVAAHEVEGETAGVGEVFWARAADHVFAEIGDDPGKRDGEKHVTGGKRAQRAPDLEASAECACVKRGGEDEEEPGQNEDPARFSQRGPDAEEVDEPLRQRRLPVEKIRVEQNGEDRQRRHEQRRCIRDLQQVIGNDAEAIVAAPVPDQPV